MELTKVSAVDLTFLSLPVLPVGPFLVFMLFLVIPHLPLTPPVHSTLLQLFSVTPKFTPFLSILVYG